MSTTPPKPTVLVTGSSGLIGNRTCQQLTERYHVVGLDINPPEDRISGLQWIKCDFTDAESVAKAVREVIDQGFDTLASVIHLAAYYDFSGEPSPLYDDLTVAGTRRLLLALQAIPRVEQFVFSSSLLVMKPCEPNQLLTEESPTQAEWEYPESKLKAEEVIRQDHGGIPAVILRVAGVYDEDGHSLPITQNIKRIAERQLESYFFPGDAHRGQAFVHLDDVVNCFARVIEKRRELDSYETFLVAESECLSYEKLQDIIGELLHGTEDWPTYRIPKSVAKAGAWVKDHLASSEEEEPFIKPWMVDLADAHYPVDNLKARKQLDWQPQHQLSKTLPEMMRRLQQDPQRWYEENDLPLPEDLSLLDRVCASASR